MLNLLVASKLLGWQLKVMGLSVALGSSLQTVKGGKLLNIEQ